jgi:hypothetical protein
MCSDARLLMWLRAVKLLGRYQGKNGQIDIVECSWDGTRVYFEEGIRQSQATPDIPRWRVGFEQDETSGRPEQIQSVWRARLKLRLPNT